MRQVAINYVARHLALIKPDCIDIGGRIVRGQERYFEQLADLLKGMSVKVVDMQPGLNVNIVADAAKELPFPADSVGSAICIDTLEHVNNPFNLFHNVHAVLRPGGVFIVTTVFNFQYHAFPQDYWRFTLPGLEYLFQDAGFEIVDLEQQPAGVMPVSIFGAGRKP